jgi:multiple sugar transport system ATP-binding protein
MGAVTLSGIRKSYGAVDVIKGIDLEVQDGEFIVFVGPSGCGKSTTLRMVAGLESISAGDLFIDGVRANELRPANRGAAMVFQSYALYPHMTVGENMAFSLKMAGVSKAERVKQVSHAAEVLHITQLLNRLPKDLSGGQRQRVAIGRAIVRKPKVFLFDEPLSNLDAALRVNMRIELSRLHKELGTTMIYVTHDQVEAMTMGDRIAVFNEGRVEQVGTPMTLYNLPINEFVAGFLGMPKMNLLTKPKADHASAEHQKLWALLTQGSAESVQKVGIRPENISLRDATQGVPAVVVLAEHLGDSSIVYLRVNGVDDLIQAKVGMQTPALTAEEVVGVVPKTEGVVCFDSSGNAVSS